MSDDIKTKGTYYQTNLTHPLVNTTNRRYQEKLSNKLHTPYAYLQHVDFESESVTGVVERIENNPNVQVVLRLDGRDGVFYGTLPSMYPTGGTGKSIGIPKAGQRFAGIKRAYSSQIHITTFFNLQSDTGEEGTETSLKPAADGDTKIKSGGKFAPEVGMTEAGLLTMRAGNSASEVIDGAQGKKITSLIESHFETHGNTEKIDFFKTDITGVPMTSQYIWAQGKHKDINFVTDKWNMPESPLMLPGIGPYVDKAVIKSGFIKGDDPIEELGHVYEISTRQSHTKGYQGGPVPMTPSLPPPVGTDKTCWSYLQMGKQNENKQNGTSRPGGEIFSIRTKDFYTDGWPGLPQPQTQLFRLGKVDGSPNEIMTLRAQYGGGLANIPSTGEGWDIADEFHESHSLVWGGDGSEYYKENHHSFAGPYDLPIIADITEGVKQAKTYSQSGALRNETLTYNSAGPLPETFNYTHTVSSSSDWWARTFLHSDGAMAPTETSYTAKFSTDKATYKHLLSEAAGDSSSELTLGTDTGKVHVDTAGETATMSLATDLGEIKVANTDGSSYKLNFSGGKVTIDITPASGDPQSITMDGGNIIIDAGPTPADGKILIGGSGGEQQLVTKSWIDQVFMTHMHPTAAPGGPSPPIAPPAVPAPNSPLSPLTFETKAE